jgi:chorismate dehydratase
VKKIKISAVSYTNSKPFIYGLQHSDILEKIELSLDTPSDCAQKLISGTADIGLVPVAALLNIPDHHIVADYCIGASQAVNSVFIFSNVPIQELKTLRLDAQSRTSNNLAKVLLKNYWELSPKIVEEDAEPDGFVEIGDRTFGKTTKFPYVYDLAEEWIKFTGLPFAFAVWAANRSLPDDFIKEFNEALKLGVDNREAVIKEISQRDDFDLGDYLMNRIDFVLDDKKKQAISKFLAFVQAL